MSVLYTNPTEDYMFYNKWKEEIINQVNFLFENLKDKSNLDKDRLKCLVYLVEPPDVVILLFPLIMIDGDDILDDGHLLLMPLFTIPHDKMDIRVSQFLGLDIEDEDEDPLIQELDLGTGMGYYNKCTRIESKRHIIDRLYLEWMENNMAPSIKCRTSMLHLASRMMKISIKDYDSFKMDMVSVAINK